MAYEYALVHLKFTVPLAAVLTAIAYPLLTRRHWYQTAILVTIAVVATIPWDSYLIRHNVWTYPPDAILGPKFWSIPAEELFFFVIQTYTTSLLYLLLNKPLLHAEYLFPAPQAGAKVHRLVQGVIAGLVFIGARLITTGGPGTYLGLILIWACPFALLTWSLGGRFMLALPWTSTWLPIAATTAYLWAVDEGALRRGTWSIESGTKLGATLFGHLDIEEAVFFLATNTLIVFGLGAFDNALAVIDAFPEDFPVAPECPGPVKLIRALLLPWTQERIARTESICEAVDRLCRKSRSFYLASSTFAGRLRLDLILLYSYCRMADDLIDEPPEGLDTAEWIARLAKHLDLVYKPKKALSQSQQEEAVRTCIDTNFPYNARSALIHLPTPLLPPEPLYLLLEGFKTDCSFPSPKQKSPKPQDFPIANEDRLAAYGSQVAGTVGQLCLSLISHHSTRKPINPAHRDDITAAAGRMGIALQYVNIARDIAVDAALGRVYLPTTWLAEEGLAPQDVIEAMTSSPSKADTIGKLVRLRKKLLAKAFAIYGEARPTMDWLPDESRRPMIVAVESYMEIGRVLLAKDEILMGAGEGGRLRRATVPKSRRLLVALRALLYA